MDNRAGLYFSMVFFAALLATFLWIVGNQVWVWILGRF